MSEIDQPSENVHAAQDKWDTNDYSMNSNHPDNEVEDEKHPSLMSLSSQSGTDVVLLEVLSDGSVRLTWEIVDFCELHFANGECRQSPVFSGDSQGQTRWELLLYPNGNIRMNANFFSLALKNVSGRDILTSAGFHIYFLGMRNHKFLSKRGTICLAQNDLMGFAKFTSRKNLFRQKSQLLPEDRMTIVCHFRDLIYVKHNRNEKPTIKEPENDSSKLVRELKDVLAERKFGDVRLRAENKEIEAHKAILSARSAVFRDIFEKELISEREERVVEVSDMSFETLNQLVLYLYHGCMTELSLMSAMELHAAAVKYGASDLQNTCVGYLKDNLSATNSLQVLTFAEHCDDEILKKEIICFLRHHIDEVASNPEWKDALQRAPNSAITLLLELTAKMK